MPVCYAQEGLQRSRRTQEHGPEPVVAKFAWFVLRRRPLLQSAQQFDRQFGLQERLSTALELTDGHIHTLPEIARQLLQSMLSPQPDNRPASIHEVKEWLEMLKEEE